MARSFRYAHLADLHLGSWREEKMRSLSTTAFLRAIDECIENKVDFVLFSGDLFNTSIPSLEILKTAVLKLRELKEAGIPLYAIAGSHDYSPSGKTIIDVLENAGMLRNVCKGKVDLDTQELHLSFTVDPKTGAKITGILGRRGLLERAYYESLHTGELEAQQGYKIFMFHTTVGEMLGEDLAMIESQPISFFPKGFDYYAGGHIHHPTNKKVGDDYGCVTYTGALFPNNFSELEKYGQGGYYVVDVEEVDGRDAAGKEEIAGSEGDSKSLDGKQDVVMDNGGVERGVGGQKGEAQRLYQQRVVWRPLKVIECKRLVLKCSGKSPEVIAYDIIEAAGEDIAGAVVTIRLEGMLEGGKPTDINWKGIVDQLYQNGAYFVMRNTSRLESEKYEEVQMGESDPAMVEERIIAEHLQQLSTFDKDTELELTRGLLQCLNTTKLDGENISDFLERIESDINKLLGISWLDDSEKG